MTFWKNQNFPLYGYLVLQLFDFRNEPFLKCYEIYMYLTVIRFLKSFYPKWGKGFIKSHDEALYGVQVGRRNFILSYGKRLQKKITLAV